MLSVTASPGWATTAAVPGAMFALWAAGEFETSDELLARRVIRRLVDDDKPHRVSRRGRKILIEIVEPEEVAG